MKIKDLFTREEPVFSFEFFPPKTDEAAEQLMATVADLRSALSPGYVSVTYGAGGSTRGRTLECVRRIQSELDITSMAHLTCVGHTADELSAIADDLHRAGIENVLALRGDPPKGAEGFEAVTGGFANASQLVKHLRESFDFCLGGACYPEKHPESPSADQDLSWLVHKVQQGTEFLVTQLFFSNEDYFAFVERARAAGITIPIVPGIMPITNVAQIERFTSMCGARIPDELRERLGPIREDPAAVMAAGIEHAVLQCRELLSRGAPGIHFYTLNKSSATRSILASIKEI
ncbi:MAG: methylenetetrahydrofolate reductase [NAD(P)H] [Planctomycetota bacterium]